MNNRDFLRHYGILGMHWGRKKGNTVSVTPSKNSEDHNKKVELKKKKLSEMTNDELRAYTQRMMLEKQYKELSKTELSAGKKFVNGIINTATKGATDAVNNYIKKLASDNVDKLLKKTIGDKVKDKMKDKMKETVKSTVVGFRP